MKRFIHKGSALLALPLLCSFFNFSKPSQWTYQETKVSGTRVAVLNYEPKNKQTGIGIEFFKSDGEMHTYLSLFKVALGADFHEKEVYLTLKTPEREHQGIAYCLGGGQRFILGKPSEAFLLGELDQDQPVTIEIASFSSTIFTESFHKYMKKFQKA